VIHYHQSNINAQAGGSKLWFLPQSSIESFHAEADAGNPYIFASAAITYTPFFAQIVDDQGNGFLEITFTGATTPITVVSATEPTLSSDHGAVTCVDGSGAVFGRKVQWALSRKVISDEIVTVSGIEDLVNDAAPNGSTAFTDESVDATGSGWNEWEVDSVVIGENGKTVIVYITNDSIGTPDNGPEQIPELLSQTAPTLAGDQSPSLIFQVLGSTTGGPSSYSAQVQYEADETIDGESQITFVSNEDDFDDDHSSGSKGSGPPKSARNDSHYPRVRRRNDTSLRPNRYRW
jgi:hypothetical protein